MRTAEPLVHSGGVTDCAPVRAFLFDCNSNWDSYLWFSFGLIVATQFDFQHERGIIKQVYLALIGLWHKTDRPQQLRICKWIREPIFARCLSFDFSLLAPHTISCTYAKYPWIDISHTGLWISMRLLPFVTLTMLTTTTVSATDRATLGPRSTLSATSCCAKS